MPRRLVRSNGFRTPKSNAKSCIKTSIFTARLVVLALGVIWLGYIFTNPYGPQDTDFLRAQQVPIRNNAPLISGTTVSTGGHTFEISRQGLEDSEESEGEEQPEESEESKEEESQNKNSPDNSEERKVDEPEESPDSRVDKNPDDSGETKESNSKDSEESGEENTEKKGDNEKNEGDSEEHTIAGLQCEKYGGPEKEWAQKMVYWRNIPQDSAFISPYKDPTKEKYLTFEPDGGGWNNLRMSWETMVAMAHAMGRTLVLPPEQHIYLLDAKNEGRKYTFNDFYHMESLADEHEGLDVITTEEFLTRMKGKFTNIKTGEPSPPPQNGRTAWDRADMDEIRDLVKWERSVFPIPEWNGDECILVFAETPEKHKDIARKVKEIQEGKNEDEFEELIKSYIGNPTPVNGPVRDRLKENNAKRTGGVCPYDEKWQDEMVIHFVGEEEVDKNDKKISPGHRMLTHFYTFLFFEDWKQDLWTKRFIRDHVRYVDELQCAAARIVKALLEHAKEHHGGDYFDSMHVRRGDFQYKETRISADEMVTNTKDVLKKGGLVYIATDERDKSFFKPFGDRYDVKYLDDYMHLIEGVNPNMYGVIDQLIAAKGRHFVGTFYSSFSSYINRMRGYHRTKRKLTGYEEGVMDSYFYMYPSHEIWEYGKFNAVSKPFWSLDYPASWRDIDHDVTND